jgi:hypothetical protein
LVEIRICHRKGGNTPKPFQHSSRRMSEKMPILRCVPLPRIPLEADMTGLDINPAEDNADRIIP